MADQEFEIISFGSAIIDIFLKSSEFKLVDNIDKKMAICGAYGEKINIEEKVVSGGGGGTNTAVSFSRLGLNSAVSARLGNDLWAKLVTDELKREGVNIDLLATHEEETDISVILIGSDGGRTILVHRGKTRLEKDDINWDKLRAKWFYLASLEGNLDLAEELINFAEKKAIKVAWNPGRKELVERERVSRLARKVNVFILNKEEIEELISKKIEDNDQFWQGVKELGVKLSIVTDGRNGAYLLSEKGLIFKPSPQLTPVDETGAGDAFASGFIVGLIKGMSLEDAFSLAMRNGASVVQKIGAKTGLLKKI